MEFRRPSWAARDAGGVSHFTLAVGIFLLVALVYPWYSYWVNAYLLTRGLEQAAEQFQTAVDHQDAKLSAEFAQSQQAARASQVQYAQQSQQNRVAGVRVTGVSTGGDKPMVLVDFGSSNLDEADTVICRQAAAWLGHDLSGSVLRIQRHRGSRPALESGELACP